MSICASQSQLRNIATLPTEILSEICQLVCDDASDFKTRNLESFQLVCGTFRSVAIGTLQVWSCVDDRMSLERMELQLSRGGRTGMLFRIAFDGRFTPPTCKCPQWNLMKLHHSRWTRGFAKLSRLDQAKQQHCSDTLTGVHLPSLTSLSWDFSYSDYRHKNLNWILPRLESIHCKSDWDVLFPLTAPLKDFTVSIDSSTRLYDDNWVIRFLARRPAESIAAMTIDFSKTEKIKIRELPKPSWRVPLHKLETLHADFGYPYNISDAIEFLRHLDTPNLKRLRLRVNDHIARGDHLWRWLGKLTQEAERSLETVHVVFAVECDPDDRAELRQKVLDLFPSPQRIVAAGSGSQSSDGDVVPHMHFLKVTFEDNRPDRVTTSPRSLQHA